jgi:hypothetical protein
MCADFIFKLDAVDSTIIVQYTVHYSIHFYSLSAVTNILSTLAMNAILLLPQIKPKLVGQLALQNKNFYTFTHFKETVSRDFRPSVFFVKLCPWVP